MADDKTGPINLSPLSEEELDNLRKKASFLEDLDEKKKLRSGRAERFKLINEQLKDSPTSSELESQLDEFKKQSKYKGFEAEVDRKRSVIPNRELKQRLTESTHSKNKERLAKEISNRLSIPSSSDLPIQSMDDIGDVVKDIDLDAYRASKAAENPSKALKFKKLAEKIPLGKIANVAKTGGKAALKIAGPLSSLIDLLNPEEASAGADVIPGRPSFEDLYGRRGESNPGIDSNMSREAEMRGLPMADKSEDGDTTAKREAMMRALKGLSGK